MLAAHFVFYGDAAAPACTALSLVAVSLSAMLQNKNARKPLPTSDGFETPLISGNKHAEHRLYQRKTVCARMLDSVRFCFTASSHEKDVADDVEALLLERPSHRHVVF